MRDPGVGIVDHEHVARLERAAVLVQHVGHHLDEEGQLKRRGIALADEPTLAVPQRSCQTPPQLRGQPETCPRDQSDAERGPHAHPNAAQNTRVARSLGYSLRPPSVQNSPLTREIPRYVPARWP